MAIFDFTKISSLVFSRLFSLPKQHEKNSSLSTLGTVSGSVSFAGLSERALAMVSHTYHFVRNCPDYPPEFASYSLGACRVVGVAITELSPPQLLLLPLGGDDPQYYEIAQLDIFDVDGLPFGTVENGNRKGFLADAITVSHKTEGPSVAIGPQSL